MEDAKRFWSKVQKTDGCWNWTAAKLKSGYGMFRLGSKMVYAHRRAYELSGLTIPDDTELDHTCRNRHCVNPEHLEPVSHQVNVARGVAGIGQTWCRGEGSGVSKLKEQEVLEIRRLYAAGGMTQNELAVRFGIHRSAVHLIIACKRWAHSKPNAI